MNLKEKRRRIRKKYFSIPGLIIINILGFVGIVLIYFSGIFNVENLNMAYDYYVCGIMIILGLFFFGLFLYFWVLFFLNIILNPKKEVLYLSKVESGKTYFINNKGKKFVYDYCNKKENCYYYVLKTHNYIYSILEEYNGLPNNWTAMKKKSYWINLYSPIGNFEDMFLLPIVYFILLISLLTIFIFKGQHKIYGLIFGAVPFYLIVYDIIYKIKLNHSNNNQIDETKFLKSYEIFKSGTSVAIVGIFSIIFIDKIFELIDFKSKLVLLPFLGCVFSSIGFVLTKVFKQHRLQMLFSKCCVIVFLICWFGFLVFWTTTMFEQDGGYLYTLLSVPFWILGGYIIYKHFLRRNK